MKTGHWHKADDDFSQVLRLRPDKELLGRARDNRNSIRRTLETKPDIPQE